MLRLPVAMRNDTPRATILPIQYGGGQIHPHTVRTSLQPVGSQQLNWVYDFMDLSPGAGPTLLYCVRM